MGRTTIDVDEALRVFASLVEERGPSVREYQKALGLPSTSQVDHRIRLLAKRGLIERIPESTKYSSRRWRLTVTARAKVLG